MPKISVVLPTYNGEKYLRESIDSIVSQTESDWELIIVNDASTDRTLDISHRYTEEDSRIKLITNDYNKKTPSSLNRGFSASSGRYLTWTSDDNIYKRDAFKVMSYFLEENKSYDFVCCEYDFCDENGSLIKSHSFDKGNSKAHFLLGSCNVGGCFMYTRDLYNRVGEYNPDFFCVEDYEYWIRIALEGNMKYLNTNQYIFRSHAESITSTKEDIVRNKTRTLQKKYFYSFLDKFDISNKDMASIYYSMWKYDTDSIYLLDSAVKLDKRYLLRGYMHKFKLFRRDLVRSLRGPL